MIIFIVVALWYFGEYWAATYWTKWFLACSWFSLYFAVKQGLKIHISVVPLLAWALVSGCIIVGLETSKVGVPLLGFYSGYSMVALLLLVHWAANADRRKIDGWKKAFEALCILESVIVIGQALLHWGKPEYFGGTLGNPSMAGCFIAFLFPFVRNKLKFLPPIAILLTQASIPVATFVAVCLALFSWRWALGSVGVVAGALLMQGPNNNFFDSSGRFAVWQLAWQRLNFLGHGTGTTTYILSQLQLEGKAGNVELFMWMHNDWLQIAFEQGWLGFAFGALAAGCALQRCQDKVVKAAFIGYCTAALGNFPMRLAAHAMVGIMLLKMCFYKDDL